MILNDFGQVLGVELLVDWLQLGDGFGECIRVHCNVCLLFLLLLLFLGCCCCDRWNAFLCLAGEESKCAQAPKIREESGLMVKEFAKESHLRS